MPRLLYITPARIPTEKAHGLQIVQNCEAFADNGWDIELWVPRRFNAAMKSVDVFEYYGVERNFSIRYLPTLDLIPHAHGRQFLERIAHYIGLASFSIVVLAAAALRNADGYYTREPLVAFLLSLTKPRSSIAYEVHTLAHSRLGLILQRAAVRRSAGTFAISQRLVDDLVARGADPRRVHVARDAVREARFADAPPRDAARAELGWPDDAFIVGYVGRLQTMGVDKGVETLLDAVAQLPQMLLAVVGGPDDAARALRRRWERHGLDDRRFLYVDHVPPHRVPIFLSALDVCTMPYPATREFALYMSPLKLFEYMAAHRPIVASDLPSIREVLEDRKTALLVQPDDVPALVAALEQLHGDAQLRESLVANASAEVMRSHTWSRRAAAILGQMNRRPRSRNSRTAAAPG